MRYATLFGFLQCICFENGHPGGNIKATKASCWCRCNTRIQSDPFELGIRDWQEKKMSEKDAASMQTRSHLGTIHKV